MNREQIIQLIQEETSKTFQKRIGDTPIDALQLVNRKYVNLNGTIASRPNSSVASLGQQYFATDLGYPVFFNGTHWSNSVGSVIGL